MSIKVSMSQNSALISWIPARDGARPYPEARHRRKRSKAERRRLFRAQVEARIVSARVGIVVPAKVGTHQTGSEAAEEWIPAFAGTTIWGQSELSRTGAPQPNEALRRAPRACPATRWWRNLTLRGA